jgi:hypothetical protein
MRLSRRAQRAHLDSASVVLYLKQFHAAILDGDAEGCGASVQAVLEQFLEGRRRSMYDLESGKQSNSQRGACRAPGSDNIVRTKGTLPRLRQYG